MNRLEERPRIAVVGAGAVGCFFGGKLARAGLDVTFLVRSDFAHIAEHGIEVRSCDGDFQLAAPQIAQCSSDIGEVDVILVAWKTTSDHAFAEVLGPLMGEGTIVITLENGLGSVDALAELYGAKRVLGGICFICSSRVAPGVIEHTAGGRIQIGAAVEGASDLAAQMVEHFRAAGVDSVAVESLGYAQWAKLLWNVPFNGLAIAKGGVTTDSLLAEPQWEAEVRELMVEVIEAAAALGHTIPRKFIDQQIERTQAMGAYRPSSMIDYVEKRPVEVDTIWREPLRRAKAAGADLPAWERLLVAISERIEGPAE